jgi:hypothetical protein
METNKTKTKVTHKPHTIRFTDKAIDELKYRNNYNHIFDTVTDWHSGALIKYFCHNKYIALDIEKIYLSNIQCWSDI